MSGFLEEETVHAWLDCLRDNAWCSLHYESPQLMGDGRGEITGGGYIRRQLVFSEPMSKTIWQIEPVKFVGLNAYRLTHFGVWNHKVGGKLRAGGELPVDGRLVAQGGGYVIRPGLIAISLDA